MSDLTRLSGDTGESGESGDSGESGVVESNGQRVCVVRPGRAQLAVGTPTTRTEYCIYDIALAGSSEEVGCLALDGGSGVAGNASK